MNIPPGFYQVNCRMTGDALPRKAECVFGVDGPPGAALSTIANLVADAWAAGITPRQSTTVILSEVHVKEGPNETGPDFTFATNLPGTGDFPVDSPQVAVLLRKTTAFGGRVGRGRMFVPGLHEVDTLPGGRLTDAAYSSWSAGAAAFLNSLSTATIPMVLLHNSPELVPYPVTSLVPERLLATQRRRLRRVGGRRRPLT